jgi:hypothetical protein
MISPYKKKNNESKIISVDYRIGIKNGRDVDEFLNSSNSTVQKDGDQVKDGEVAETKAVFRG